MNKYFSLIDHELQQIVSLDEKVLHKLLAFIDVLLVANQTTNLTSITDYQEALFKHIYDSLIIMKRPEFENATSIIDIGSGAGIPGIPLAIAQPHKQLTMLEATQKKVNFQCEVLQKLEIPNAIPLWGRAEEIAHQTTHRESYDLAIGRAVSAASILAELTLPFVKLNGYAIFYKGQDYHQEAHESLHALDVLGGKLTDIMEFTLPFNYGSRSLIIIKKIKSTPPLYPRKPGTPQKKPLLK